jgi:hypothetical protein
MDGEESDCLRPDRKDFWNLRHFWLPFRTDDQEEESIMDRLESANRVETTRWLRFFEQLMEFSDYERKAEMVCPICKSPFPEAKRLPAAVDRISSCDHCLGRVISFLNGKRPYFS